MEAVKVQSRDGAKVEVATQTFTIPPLTVNAWRDLTRAGHFEAIDAAVKATESATPEQRASLIEAGKAIVSAALRPFDPSCTEEWVGSLPLTPDALTAMAGAILAASKPAAMGQDSGKATSP
jgi:urease accessory protein UreF